jgi:hypothetical protein
MDIKPIKFINTRLIVFLIFGINLVFFLIYYFAYPAIPLWEKLWNYLSSAIFTLVTGSLIIPLLLSILEKRYKFIENIQKQREDRRKQIEDQRRLGRRETINDTIGMWQELYILTTEVIYFEPGKDGHTEINQVITKLIRFPSSAEVTVNKWGHQYPNLKFEDHDIFLSFVNVVYQSALSIALYIQRGIEKKQRNELQNMLNLILDQVKSIVHHRMIDVFKYSANLLEIEEGEGDKQKVQEYKRNIQMNLDLLSDWAKGITQHDNLYDNFLAPSEGPEINEIRTTVRSIEKWLVEDRNRQVNQSEHFVDLQKQFYQIDMNDRVSSAAIPYSIEYIKAVANWLSFEAACVYIYNRAHKIW